MSLAIALESDRVSTIVDEVRTTGEFSQFYEMLTPLFEEDKDEFTDMLKENISSVTDLLQKQSSSERHELGLEIMKNTLVMPTFEYKQLEKIVDDSRYSEDAPEAAAFVQHWRNGETYCVYNAGRLRTSRGPAYIRHETTHWISRRLRLVKGEVLSAALADTGFLLSDYEAVYRLQGDYAVQTIWGNMIANIPFPDDDSRRRFQMDLIYSEDLSYGRVAALANKQFRRERREPFL